MRAKAITAFLLLATTALFVAGVKWGGGFHPGR